MSETVAGPSSMTAQTDLSAFNAWRRSLAQLTGLGLNDEEKRQRQEEMLKSNADRDCRRCEKWRDEAIATSMLANLETTVIRV